MTSVVGHGPVLIQLHHADLEQVALALPLYILFEISILVSKAASPKKSPEEEETEE